MGGKRIKLTVSYEGTRYHGFQRQPTGITVQESLEKAIEQLQGEPVRIVGSGRTDAGVHARGQVVHFDTEAAIPPERWGAALNSVLPDDIVVRQSEQVSSSFHARYDVKSKTYRYLIDHGRVRDVFLRNRAWHISRPLDLESMVTAATAFVGTHDFTAFCSAKADVGNRVRTITRVDIEKDGNRIWLTFMGNGFLYNMVRIMTGTLVEVGAGKRDVAEIPHLIEAKDRTLTGITAPPQGLYLWSVDYED